MKAILDNGNLKYSSQYKFILHDDGSKTYTLNATDKQWLDWGFKDIEEPVFDSSTHNLGDWYETDTIITRDVIDKTKEEIDTYLDLALVNKKQNQFNELQKTDWYIIRNIETGVEVPANILKARELIRGEY